MTPESLTTQIDKVIEEKTFNHAPTESYTCYSNDSKFKAQSDYKAGANFLKPALIRALEALDKYPCFCQSTLEEVKNTYPNLRCAKCKAIAEIKEMLGIK